MYSKGFAPPDPVMMLVVTIGLPLSFGLIFGLFGMLFGAMIGPPPKSKN
jgi:hypothetical protein